MTLNIVMTLNIEEQAADLLSRSGGIIEYVEDFIYLGSWIDGTEKGYQSRKGRAWTALHRLRNNRNIWNSKLSQKLKIRLFIAACESILLYGSEAWTLTRAQEKSVDMGHTPRCCVWCWVFHGGIGSAMTSYMGTYQNHQKRSEGGGLSWQDAA